MEKVDYGFVERVHGLRGRLILKLFVLGPAVPLEEGSVIWLGEDPYTVARSRKRDNERITVDLEGVLTREASEELRGRTVTVELDTVLREGHPLPVNGFSGFTLISSGKSFSVVEVQYNSTNPQLIATTGDRTFPVPLNLALSGTVNREARTIAVELPEGLEEL